MGWIGEVDFWVRELLGECCIGESIDACSERREDESVLMCGRVCMCVYTCLLLCAPSVVGWLKRHLICQRLGVMCCD